MIREAAEEDWPRVYPIFATIVTEGRTFAYPENLSCEEARWVWMEKPPGRTVIAVDGARELGSAKMGPNRPGRGSHVATASFMVDPSCHGRSIGRALGEHVLTWATTPPLPSWVTVSFVRWARGEAIVRREVLNDGRPWLANMVYVVEDSPEHLVTYLPAGTT